MFQCAFLGKTDHCGGVRKVPKSVTYYLNGPYVHMLKWRVVNWILKFQSIFVWFLESCFLGQEKSCSRKSNFLFLIIYLTTLSGRNVHVLTFVCKKSLCEKYFKFSSIREKSCFTFNVTFHFEYWMILQQQKTLKKNLLLTFAPSFLLNTVIHVPSKRRQ